MIFRIAQYEFEIKIQKFKIVDLKWWTRNFVNSQHLMHFFEFRNKGFLEELESEIKILEKF